MDPLSRLMYGLVGAGLALAGESCVRILFSKTETPIAVKKEITIRGVIGVFVLIAASLLPVFN